MADELQIGPLHGGGLVLGYRCSSRCRHCLYGAGPHRRDGEPPSEQALEALLDSLAERGPAARYHIGGGEPFLDMDRLERAVAGLVGRGLALDYVETNAAWVRDRSHAASTLERLAGVGLGCVLVSLSPFHAEHIALRKTLELITAAEQVLSGGAFVWIEPFMADLAGQPRERPIDLDALLTERGDAYARDLCSRYHLVPAGRAGRFLAHHGQRLPWRALARRAPCGQRLCDTSHFHVDGEGQYVPGLCPGLVVPLDQLPGRVDLDAFPLLRQLWEGELEQVVDRAVGDGFTPDDGYSSACDLCTHVRVFLYPGGRYAELGPAGFYDPRSVPGFG
ncbi:MAG: radical SAM protein [Deltaproteobacteria bacterium]|nr:radical SAM protein [Deltaproteobacteria bacterium]